MSLVEGKLSRRSLLKSGFALALSSCGPYPSEDHSQNGTRGLRADPNPRLEPLQVAVETSTPLNIPKEKLYSEIMAPLTGYTSDFRKSEPYRIHNIKAGSNAINNWFWEFDGSVNNKGELNKTGKNLIKPGESFALGPIIEKADYVKGFAIGPGLKSIEVDGGGICQISTTLNALALISGLKIEERKNHDYYNGWYFGERNDPKEFGMDATIFIPGQDWIVTNTYANPIRFLLLEKDGKLTAQIHSTADSTPFHVELESSMTWPKVYKGKHLENKPLKDIVAEVGAIEDACTTELIQRVYVQGKWGMSLLLFEDKFRSVYQTSPYKA